MTAVRNNAAHDAVGFHVEALVELAVALARRAGRVMRHGRFVGTGGSLAPAEPLTPREREAAKLVAQGLTDREIAQARPDPTAARSWSGSPAAVEYRGE